MKITKYIRYSAGTKISYGILEEQTIRELHGDIFGGAEPTGTTAKLSEVKVLAPCEPSKVIAVGRNYKSHIADRNIELIWTEGETRTYCHVENLAGRRWHPVERGPAILINNSDDCCVALFQRRGNCDGACMPADWDCAK